MVSRSLVLSLKVLIAAVVLASLSLQVLVLPWLAASTAKDNPDFAHLRGPVLLLVDLGLLCLEVVMGCTWHLLTKVSRSRIFDAGSLRWVNGIIIALLAGAMVSLVMFFYLIHEGAGPITVPGTALVGVLGGLGATLLMVVMRTLLHEATALRSDMDAVI